MSKFISPAELPSPLQRELLVILMEECAEVALATKDGVGKLQEEIGDLWAVIAKCAKHNVLPTSVFDSYEAYANSFGSSFAGLSLDDLGDKFLDHLFKMQIRASKAIRFGILEIEPGQSRTNAERLCYETASFIEIVCHFIESGNLDMFAIERQGHVKAAKLEKYLQS